MPLNMTMWMKDEFLETGKLLEHSQEEIGNLYISLFFKQSQHY